MTKLLTREGAIRALMHLSFTRDEARRVLLARSEIERDEITLQVQKRVQRSQAK